MHLINFITFIQIFSQRSDSSKSKLNKLKVLENIINPGKYNFDYPAKEDLYNTSKKKEIFNKIPSGKSRSHSKDNTSLKENNKFYNNNNEENKEILKANLYDYSSEVLYTILSQLIKHYLSANEIIISYVAEELKTNVSKNVTKNFN